MPVWPTRLTFDAEAFTDPAVKPVENKLSFDPITRYVPFDTTAGGSRIFLFLDP
jgi:hypothetical protein